MTTKDKEDKDKFENIAKELECDESDDALDKAMDDLSVKVEKEKEDPKE